MTANPWADANPYQPPPITNSGLDGSPQPLPGMLVALAIIGLVLGGLGLMASVTGVIGAIAGPALQKMMSGLANVPGEAGEAQARMMSDQAAIMERYMIVNLVAGMIGLALSIGLLTGSIQTLRRKEVGRKVLVWACLGAMFFEVARAIPNTLMQLELGAVMEKSMSKMVQSPAPNQRQQQAGAMASSMAQAAMVVGLVIAFVMMVVKLAYYIITTVYLRSPRIRAFFPSPTANASGG